MMRTSVALCSLVLALSSTHAFAQLVDAGVVVAGSGALSPSGSTVNPGNIVVRLIKTGGVDFPDKNSPAPITPVGKRACDQGTITVTLGSLPIVDQYPFLEAWVATGNGNCNAADRNSRTATSGNTLNCTRIDLGDATKTVPRPYAEVDIPIKNDICGTDGSTDGNWTIYFLALQSQNATEAATYFGTLTFTLDTVAPNPPTDLRGGPGETQIEMKWNLPVGESPQYSWLMVDTQPVMGGNDDADAGSDICHSTIMREGGDFDPNMPLPNTAFIVTEQMRSLSHTFNGDEDFFGSKLVAMIAVSGDRAGNPSKMSNVACVQVVQTSGFWDRYVNNGGTAEPGCACSVPGSRSGGMGLLAGLPSMAIIGLLAARRRRRVR